MTPCQGMFGRLFGHKMVQVFDTDYRQPEWAKDRSTIFDDMFYSADIFESIATKKSTYRHSICTRCGLVVKQEDK